MFSINLGGITSEDNFFGSHGNVCSEEEDTKRSSNTLLRLVYFSAEQTLVIELSIVFLYIRAAMEGKKAKAWSRPSLVLGWIWKVENDGSSGAGGAPVK